jgi:hypothetical protein
VIQDSPGIHRRRSGRQRRAGGLTAVVAAVTLAAACGGGGSHPLGPATPGRSGVQQMDLFAQCMRTHGEPDFYFSHPDSAANPSATVLSFMGYQVIGIDPQTAQFTSAMHSCKHLLPGGGPKPITQRQLDSMVKSAACTRAHGFPDYPDPERDPNGGIEVQPLPSSIDTSSPQFEAALKACGES